MELQHTEVHLPAEFDFARLRELAERIASNRRASNTMRAYAADWRDYQAFCEKIGARPTTNVGLLTMYFTHLVDRGMGIRSIIRRRSGLAWMFREAGYPEDPFDDRALRQLFKGLGRTIGAPPEKKQAAVLTIVKAMIDRLAGDELRVKRDRAILLVGFAAALRRSEIVGLRYENLAFELDGINITIVGSKTDRSNKGQVVGIARGEHPETCPVHALRDWLDAAGIRSGRLFRSVRRSKDGSFTLSTSLSDRMVAIIIKTACQRAGLDEAKFSGHSLRSGLVTQAAMNNVPAYSIQKTTRHRSVAMITEYAQTTNAIRDGASGRVGL